MLAAQVPLSFHSFVTISFNALFLKCTGALMLIASAATDINADWIPLNPDQLINLSGNHPVPELVDEQVAAIGAETGLSFKPTSMPKADWQNMELYYPMQVVVDLQTKHHVRRVAYFDGAGGASFSVDARTDDGWQKLFDDSLDRFSSGRFKTRTSRRVTCV
jgi:hypothetical protein